MVLCKLIPEKNRNALSGKNNFDPFSQMRMRMNNLFDDFFGDFENQIREYTPHTDVVEKENHFEVVCELPGLDENDISVSFANDMLTIEGEKKVATDENGNGYRHIERSFGSFKRMIPFGSDVDSEKAEAEFKKGVLKIKLPKIPDEKSVTKKIPVSSK